MIFNAFLFINLNKNNNIVTVKTHTYTKNHQQINKLTIIIFIFYITTYNMTIDKPKTTPVRFSHLDNIR